MNKLMLTALSNHRHHRWSSEEIPAERGVAVSNLPSSSEATSQLKNMAESQRNHGNIKQNIAVQTIMTAQQYAQQVQPIMNSRWSAIIALQTSLCKFVPFHLLLYAKLVFVVAEHCGIIMQQHPAASSADLPADRPPVSEISWMGSAACIQWCCPRCS